MESTPDSMGDVLRRFSNADAAEKWSALYETETTRLDESNYRLRRDIAVAQVMGLAKPDARILDLGCGAGPVISELRQRQIMVSGLDYSVDMLQHARTRLRSQGLDDSDLLQGDCRKTPYMDASFDVVVCLGVISYMEDYGPVLTEIQRLLKPGGTALISFRNVFNPIFSDPVSLVRFWLRTLLAPLNGAPSVEKFEIGRFLDHRVVTSKIAALGFQYIDHFGIGFGPFSIAGRPLFSERRSISISRFLAKAFSLLSLRHPLRWLTDVSLWVYQKPLNQ